MKAPTLREWTTQFLGRFNERELDYLRANRAEIRLELKDHETGEIHLHELDYDSKDAELSREQARALFQMRRGKHGRKVSIGDNQ